MKRLQYLLIIILFSGCTISDEARENELNNVMEKFYKSQATFADVVNYLNEHHMNHSFVKSENKLYASDTNVRSTAFFYKSGVFIQAVFDDNEVLQTWTVKRQYDGL